jgi:sugar phosphate permease
MGYQEPARQDSVAVQPALVFPRPTHVRYLVLAAASSLAALTYVQRQGFIAAMPYLQEALGLGHTQQGFLFAAWLVSYGLFQVPGGLLGDRLGARLLLTLLVLGWSLILGAVALIDILPPWAWLAFSLLLILRFLFGSLQAGVFPGVARVVADWVPTPQRGFAQGLIWTFSRLGGFVAPLLVGLWLIPAFQGWPIPIVILASLGLFWCAAFWPWFRNRPVEMRQVNAAERALIEANRSAPAASPPALPWSCYLRSRNVWALCLMYGFLGFSGNFITNWLPTYLKNHRGLTVEETAWLSGLPLAFGIVSCVLGGMLSDWITRRTGNANLGRRLVGCTSLALAGLTILLPIWVDEVLLLALTFSLAFFFNDGTMGPAWASCADIGERHAGTLSGAMNMTGAFLAAVAMTFAGALFDRHLDDVVFIAFACSYVLGALCWLAVDVTRPLDPPQ